MAAPQQQPPGPMQLSREEARVMRECNQESFYSRCVPLSAVLMTGTLYMVRSGRWRGAGTFGPAPKMAAAGVLGYIAGKLSYMETCKERLMALPGSKIGEMLRLRDRQQRDGEQPLVGISVITATGPPEEQEPEPAPPTRPLPPQRPDSGLDDYYRPTLDSPDTLQSLTTDDLPAAQQHTTYDQLRRQNRAEAEARLRQGTAGPAPAAQHQPTTRPPPPSQQAPPKPAGKVNQYGDAWDE